MWKFAKITELIGRGRDSQIWAARIKLPNKNSIERSINHLKSVIDDDQDLKDWNQDPSDDIKKNVVKPLKQAAAVETRRKISEQLQSEVAGVFFSLGSVMNWLITS